MHAMSKLNERASWIEPDHRNPAPLRLRNDGAGRGTIRQSLGDANHALFELGDEVKIRLGVVDHVIEQAQGKIARRQSNIFLLILEDDVVHPAFTGSTRFTTRYFRSGEILNLERHVLKHVTHPGSFAHPLKEPAGAPQRTTVVIKRREQFSQLFIETRNFIRGTILKLTNISDKKDRRHPSPDARSPVYLRSPDLDHGHSPDRHVAVGVTRRQFSPGAWPRNYDDQTEFI